MLNQKIINMNTNATLENLKKLNLQGMVKAYEVVIHLPVDKQPDAHQLLAQLSEQEILYQQEKRTKMYLRLSKLRYVAIVEQVQCSPERNFTKDKLSFLADCSWIERRENILITGATGCGKSFLACAIGHQACVMGYKSLYLNMNRFIEKIILAKADGSFIKLLNQLEKVHLLILDDFGLQPLKADVRLALLQIIEDRYQRKSTLICGQLPINKWHEYIADATLADAIMDRITSNAHRIELKGKSMRKNKTEFQ